MQENIAVKHGVKWGIFIGISYCFFLFLRFFTGEKDPLMFSVCSVVSFIVVLIALLASGFSIRKKSGGYIELKEVFKALFVAVLIYELFYAVYNFIYLKYVNPDFFIHFRDASESLLEKAKQSQSQIDKTIAAIDVDAPRKMNFWDLLKGYLFWVGISGAFAFLFALIIKRKSPPFQDQQANLFQVQS
jgi:hypothetical protein